MRVRAPGSTTTRATVSNAPGTVESPTTTLSPIRKPSGSATVMTVLAAPPTAGKASDVPNALAVTLMLLPTRPGVRATAVSAGCPAPSTIGARA